MPVGRRERGVVVVDIIFITGTIEDYKCIDTAKGTPGIKFTIKSFHKSFFTLYGADVNYFDCRAYGVQATKAKGIVKKGEFVYAVGHIDIRVSNGTKTFVVLVSDIEKLAIQEAKLGQLYLLERDMKLHANQGKAFVKRMKESEKTPEVKKMKRKRSLEQKIEKADRDKALEGDAEAIEAYEKYSKEASEIDISEQNRITAFIDLDMFDDKNDSGESDSGE